ncbi:MAG: chaperonin GroEL [bacterium]|nr:chaperonin GroEL [bacterium]
MSKQILFNEKAREAMKKGIDKLAQAVIATLGPRGKAVVIEKGYGAPQVTFDGVTVAKEIELEDKFENLGADLIKQAADKTNDAVGDGTTTSIVLAHSLIEEGEKMLKSKDVNVIQLAEDLKKGALILAKNLEAQKEPVNDLAKLAEVASLSAKDKTIGGLIAEVIHKVGKEGVVTVEDSNTISNSYEVVEGMQFDRGFISQYMITNSERMESSLENPYILVTDKKISAIAEILPILEKVVQSGKKEMVIIADDVEGEALTTLVVNKLRGVFTVLPLKAPGFGDRKKEMLQDIATITGSQFISEELGKKLEAVELADLGTAHRVVSNKDTTTIVGGKGDKKKIEERVAQLKAQLQKAESGFDKDKLQERLGKLAGGVAVIKVGAPTESAQKELKDRVEDAVAATKAAMEEGIVPGGGMALFYAGMELRHPPAGGSSIANDILIAASEAPIRAIVENCGQSPDFILNQLPKKAGWQGFDANKGKMGDLKAAGIVDPLKVTKTALMNAVSVAANYLTIGAAVTDIPKKESPVAPQMGGMGEY